MRGMIYLARCLSTGISRLVCVRRLPVSTCTILAGDRRGGNVASADVGIERLGKNRRRDEDQDRRCGQEHFSFHSPIRRYLEPTIAFPDARPSCCCEIALATTDFAFNSPHLTTDRRVQHPTLNDRVLARIRMHQDLMGWSAPLLYAYELHAPPSASD